MNISNSEILKVNDYVINHKNELNQEFGTTVKKIREEKNIGINEFAERACMNISYLRQIENGDYGVTLTKIITICNALEISPNVLLNDFIVGDKINEDVFYNELQKDKNIARNVLEILKK